MVMKLFLERVLVLEEDGNCLIKHCMPLWKLTDGDADMKTLKTFERVEGFLKSCNQQARAQCFGYYIWFLLIH